MELSFKREMEKGEKFNLPLFCIVQVVEEINLLKKFSNPHIIRFIEAFESPGEVIVTIFNLNPIFKGDFDNVKDFQFWP